MLGWVNDTLEHRFQYLLDIVEVFLQVFSGLTHSFVCLIFGVDDSRKNNDKEFANINGVHPQCGGEECVC